LPEARQALGRIVKTASRAAEIIGRIRALTRKAPVQKIELNINELILEVTALTEIAPAQLQRIDAQRFGDGIHRALDDISALRTAGSTIGIDHRRVGRDQPVAMLDK
jgi:hypothetical protein